VSRDENHQKYAYVFRLNSIGEIEWENAYHVPQVWSEAYSVAVTNDNGYIVAGDYSNEESTVSKHAWLLRIDSSGGSLWNGTYGETAQAWAVIQAADGGYVVAGSGLTKIFADRQLVARFQYNPDNPIIQETIIFNATSSYDPNQDIVSYSWDFDDGNVSSVTSPVISHRYDHSGIYNVSLMVVDAEGFNSSYSRLVNIPAGPPVARFEYSPHSPVFQETILFNASSSYDRNQDIISYLWNFDDGNITSTMNPIVVHWYENPGIYNVSLRVGDAEGFNSSYSIVVCAKNPTSLSISTSSPSAAAGYSVNITVTLLDSADMSLKNETVDLFYTFTGIENWTPISSNCTDSLGNYYANWSPPMASYFTIKAVYAGNYTHVESSRKVTVSMLPYGEMYLFSVESNSTVSSMGFDTNNQTLSFTATGEMGTVGYAKVTAAKSLVPDLALLSVHVDDAEYNYTVTDADDSWVLLFAYDHSVHLVEIQLDSTIPEFPSFLIITLFVIATLLAAIVQNIKHGFLQKRLNPLRE
jgi:PKD repeat protein